MSIFCSSSTSAPGRAALLAGAALIAGLGSAPAMAQGAPIASAAEAEPETMIVTGSRIARSGFTAPTPVSVIGTAELKAESPANIAG